MIENKVKARRLELGMTLAEVSKESEVPISTINDVEHGVEPLIRTAQRIAKALLSTTDELWPE